MAEITEPSDGGRAGARPPEGPGRQPCTSLRSKGLSWGLEEGGCRVVQPCASRPGRCRKGRPAGWEGGTASPCQAAARPGLSSRGQWCTAVAASRGPDT